jgi:hypothetical protein
MIPKIIHYCWFGRGEMPKQMKKCLKSWKKHCPDWEIIQWNEDNFDIDGTPWTKQAYEAKKYAFVADYVRLWALKEYGGVYLDTDVELVKNLDCFAELEGYVGFACTLGLSTGLVGAVKEHPYILKWFEYYRGRSFLTDTGMDIEPNTEYSTQLLTDRGLKLNDEKQTVFGMTVYPQTYFCPLYVDSFKHVKSPDTYAIHYFLATWRSEKARKSFKRAKWRGTWLYRFGENLRLLPKRVLRLILGDKAVDNWKRIIKK